jgi:hypothetical protein
MTRRGRCTGRGGDGAARRRRGTWLLVVGLLSLACSEPSVELYLTVSEGSAARAAAALRAGEASPAAQPKFRECAHCAQVEIELPTGMRFAIRTEPEPRVRFSRGDIAEIRLLELRHPLDAERSRWQAWAMLTAQAAGRLAPLVQQFPTDTVLVRVGGEPTDLHESAGALTDGVRLVVLREKEELEAFVTDLELGVPTRWESFDEEAYSELRRQLLEQMQRYEGTGDGSQEPAPEDPEAPQAAPH